MRTLLSIWGALALFCTISFAAPKIKARVDEWAEPPPGTWFDVVVRIDPAGEPLAAKGLTVTVTAKGVETKAALLPPVGATGAYAKPFEVRVPAKAPGLAAAVKLAIKVTGTTAGGAVVNAAGKATVLVAEGRNDAVATAKLKAPAKAGVPNAIVIRVDQIKAGLTLYGEKGEGEKTAGIPTVGRLLPAWGATSEALWTGGAATKAPGKKYSEPFEFEVPFTPAKAGSMSLRVFVAWQACDLSFCYSTEIRYLPLTFDVAKGKKSSRIGPVVEAPVDGGADAAGGQEDLAKKGWIQLLLLAIGGGLFALAMPCTYPLIPITISFFTKQAEAKEGKVLGLALAYGAGIVAVFILVGLVFGEAIVEFATAWQVNAVFALLFLLFGLSLIGLFEIQLPGFMNNVAAKASGTGGYLSVFAMGTTLVITSFTCTAPIVGAVIVFAGKGGSLLKVAYTMGIFGLTMAIPFVFLSLSPKALQAMPRSGMWMKKLKVTLGIIELGLVLKFLSNVDLAIGTYKIDRELFIVLWGLSFLIAGLYLLDLPALFRKAQRWSMGKGQFFAAAFLLFVTWYLSLGLDGTPLPKVLGGGTTSETIGKGIEAFLPKLPDRHLIYRRALLAVVKEDYEKGVQQAMERNAPIFLHFTGFQ